ncbi:hypothetical protein FJTKL_03201 [Diaporthe vaccinii]|uniref:Condensation domain-containing protein n=1 Tax=Diaporthe vaccinii TaxID=105482 RepID=A0ABR4DVP8_9PEZI
MLLGFALDGGMILANSVYEIEGDDLESGLTQLTELLEAKIPIFRSTIVEIHQEHGNNSNNDEDNKKAGARYAQLLLKRGSSRWIRTSDLDAYLRSTFTERMKLGGSPIQYAVVDQDKVNHEGKSFFVVSVQHSFFDVFSRSLLERDLLQILTASPAEYARAPQRPWYGDFATSMRAQSGYDARARRFWAGYLDGAEYANIHAQSLASASALQDGVINWTRLDVSGSWASEQQTPLMLAAWTLALARQSGLRDIVFGLGRHGRSHPYQDIRRTIGPFFSITPLRLRLGGASAAGGLTAGQQHPETVGELVRRVQGEILATARWEQGTIPGVYPDAEGNNPWVQCWVNVKSELYAMRNGYRDDEKNDSAKKIRTFVPRPDLHPLWMKSHWALIMVIYIKQDCVEAGVGYRSSLIGHDKANRLFEDFRGLVRELAGGEGNAVDALLT